MRCHLITLKDCPCGRFPRPIELQSCFRAEFGVNPMQFRNELYQRTWTLHSRNRASLVTRANSPPAPERSGYGQTDLDEFPVNAPALRREKCEWTRQLWHSG